MKKDVAVSVNTESKKKTKCKSFISCLQRRISNPVKHLQWSSFEKIDNSFQVLTIFTGKAYIRYSNWLKIRK